MVEDFCNHPNFATIADIQIEEVEYGNGKRYNRELGFVQQYRGRMGLTVPSSVRSRVLEDFCCLSQQAERAIGVPK